MDTSVDAFGRLLEMIKSKPKLCMLTYIIYEIMNLLRKKRFFFEEPGKVQQGKGIQE